MSASGPIRPRPAAGPLHVRPLRPEDRPRVEAIVRATGVFRESEVAIALEVIDAFFAHPDRDYSALGAFTPGGDLIGYVCYGPTPGTTRTWDVYWIAVHPAAQRAGVGTLLLQEVERRLARLNARLVIIETSSQPQYHLTRAFYARRGYAEVARVPDFYEDGDDRVIFAKRLHPSPLGDLTNGNVAADPAPESHDR
ncbi:MAG TPA: GNAT family N-acetyltransferase [Longimicrobiales bacterium]